MMQTSLQKPVGTSGIGVHSGRFVSVRLLPAEADHGVVFVRTDITDRNNIIPARIDHAIESRLCTKVENADQVGVSTIEHFMSALFGSGIDNVRIEVDGPEMPILDGSARPIVELLERAGKAVLSKARRRLVILHEISVSLPDGSSARLSPADQLELDIEIDFDDPVIGNQRLSYQQVNGSFGEQLAHARTFCRFSDVEGMRQAGLAKGGSLENAVVVDDGTVMNPDGLRMQDEFVRHKTLDVLGDLYLLGMPVQGRVTAYRPGHILSVRLLAALMANPQCWTIEDGSRQSKSAHWQIPEQAVAASV